jgi:hypothetical protein
MFVIVAMGKGKDKGVANKQFRWSKFMHNLLLEILTDEDIKENKPSNTFKPVSFALVANSISEKFRVECVTDYVDNRLRIIKNMWNIISTLRKKSGFGWDENLRMITCERNVYDEEVMVCDFFKKIYISIDFFFFEIIFFLLTSAY